MDRDYWGDMEFRLEGELRAMFWQEVSRLYTDVMTGDLKPDAFEDALDFVVANHAKLIAIVAAKLADATNDESNEE